MEEFFTQVWSIITTLVDPRNLRHPEKFQAAFNQVGVFWTVLVAVSAIIFAETGLLVGVLLPGDSMLVVLGVVAHLSGWSLAPFLFFLILAAIVGDTVGYWVGYKAGPALFSKPNGRVFKQKHLQAAREFYQKHGGKTIIFARFVPIVRTFAPVVAGAARMRYRTFLFYNVIGGVAWIVSMLLFGYYLLPIADPVFQKLLGNPNFTWAKNIDLLVVLVVFASIAPIVWKWWTHRGSGKGTGATDVPASTPVPGPAPAEKA